MIALPDRIPEDNSETNDPCPEEIARRAAAVRRGWSEAQRRRRRVQHKPSDWQPPLVFVADLNANLPSERN